MRKIKHIFFILICLGLLALNKSAIIPNAHAASAMEASEHCVEFIKAVEGFSAQPYYDYSQYTVGYGTQCPSEKYFEYKSNGITKKEAEALLQEELAEISASINEKLIDMYNLTLTQNQFDALVSFSFNIGPGWMTYDSSLRNAILRNANESDMVYAFGLYCTAGGKYLPGLITRRLCEANMYLNAIYSKNVSDDFGYVYYDANGGSLTYRVQGFLCENNTAPAADAVKSGDVFQGWYTELNGGTQVTSLSHALSGQTLFAHWQSSESTENQNTSATTIRVTGDVVNIRSGPGTNYGVVKQIYRNAVLTVSHVTHLTNMKWGKVQDGWICLDYTNYDAIVNGTGNSDAEITNKPSEDVTVTEQDNTSTDTNINTDTTTSTQPIITGTVKVNDFLKIRSGPGTNYATIGYLFNGNKVEITSQKTVGTMTWGQIADGWICMDYVVTSTNTNHETSNPGSVQEPEKEPAQNVNDSANKAEAVSIKGKITADALRIRSAAGTNNSVVGFYYQNDSVVVTEKVLVGSVYWGKTSKGWISMDYVAADVSANTSTESTSQPAVSGTKTIIADCLRVRKEAGTDHKIVAFLYYGNSVTILETKDLNGTLWGRIDQGWISMQYAVDK